MKKSADNFTPEDFRSFNIWEPVDDLEDTEHMVIPLLDEKHLNLEGIYFIATTLKLSDGSQYDGFIKVSMGEIKTIAVANTLNDFEYFYMVGDSDISGEFHEIFARQLKKKVNDVFPINYETRVQFGIRGEII